MLKLRGFLNNLACDALFYCSVGLACAIVEISARASASVNPPLIGSLLAVLVLITCVSVLASPQNGAKQLWPALAHPYGGTRQTIFRYACAHPGALYCPWNPLITLYSDGKLYHFEWGLLDRLYAQHPPTISQLRDHIPSQPAMIVYAQPIQSTAMRDVLSDYMQILKTLICQSAWFLYVRVQNLRPATVELNWESNLGFYWSFGFPWPFSRLFRRRRLGELEDGFDFDLCGVGADLVFVEIVDSLPLGTVAVELHGDSGEAVAGLDFVFGFAVDGAAGGVGFDFQPAAG